MIPLAISERLVHSCRTASLGAAAWALKLAVTRDIRKGVLGNFLKTPLRAGDMCCWLNSGLAVQKRKATSSIFPDTSV